MTKKIYVANIGEILLKFMQSTEYKGVLPAIAEEETFCLIDSFFYFSQIPFDIGITKFVGKTQGREERCYLKQINSQWSMYRELYEIKRNPKKYLLRKIATRLKIMYVISFLLAIGVVVSIKTNYVFYFFVIPLWLTIVLSIKQYITFVNVSNIEEVVAKINTK